MANVKITELTSYSAPQPADVTVVVDISNGVTKKLQLDTLINSFLPIGMITPYASGTAPNGWMLCNGSAISRTTYSALFTLIGSDYGSGDGSTTFNLPDLRGRVAVGKSTDIEFNTLGKTGGAKTHTLSSSEMPSHAHTIPNHQHGVRAEYGSSLGLNSAPPGQYNQVTNNAAYAYRYEYTRPDGGGDATSSAGSGASHNNIQPYQTINYIIKVQ